MVTWNGGLGADALKVEFFEKPKVAHAASHFGSGILTVTVGYLFRTPPGYNLYIRGPANLPKDGIAPLEGIVETDWSEATFTMNVWLLDVQPRMVDCLGDAQPVGDHVRGDRKSVV